MTTTRNLRRTLIAAAALLAAQGAHAISVGTDVSVDSTLEGVTQPILDTALTAKIKTSLASDPRLKSSSLSVTTTNHVAVLTGTAPTAAAKEAAGELAMKIDGVAKVDNQIKAPGLLSSVAAKTEAAADTSGEIITDSWITTKVKTQLLADEATRGSRIKTTTKDGIVTLRGMAGSQAEKDQAISLATAIKGVTKVDASKLKVKAAVDAQ